MEARDGDKETSATTDRRVDQATALPLLLWLGSHGAKVSLQVARELGESRLR